MTETVAERTARPRPIIARLSFVTLTTAIRRLPLSGGWVVTKRPLGEGTIVQFAITRRRAALALGLAGLLAAGTTTVVAVNGSGASQAATAGAASATRTITCNDTPGSNPFYDKPSASKIYDGA